MLIETNGLFGRLPDLAHCCERDSDANKPECTLRYGKACVTQFEAVEDPVHTEDGIEHRRHVGSISD